MQDPLKIQMSRVQHKKYIEITDQNSLDTNLLMNHDILSTDYYNQYIVP